jgi:hypothetical protein
LKIIEVIADAGHHDTILGIAEQQQVEDIWFSPTNEDGRLAAHLLVQPEHRQNVLDALQRILSAAEHYRILIIPLDTALPKPTEAVPETLSEEQKEEDKAKKKSCLDEHPRRDSCAGRKRHPAQ